MAFKLSAPADHLELKIYTHALTLAAHLKLDAAFKAGWNSAVFSDPGLANGTYYLKFAAATGTVQGAVSAPIKLMWLR